MRSAASRRSAPAKRVTNRLIGPPPARPIQYAVESPITAPAAPARITSGRLSEPSAASTAAATIAVSPGSSGKTPSPATTSSTAQ